ncbi:hypothetical protein PtA15_1A329 [Puccinia triticina]|uniref:Uncharacterized protein n=1 Tax=Puccinia triticina TaxID=208348 RepID=A0ABY7C746_9BASI|nr:uncharacterized protein PtA15_1A329 [Puccinia triticina]WAQ80991.1 hypothetical protein PtA15_1A329 [Puccinia triticina]
MSRTDLFSSNQDTVWAVNPETIGGSLFAPSSSYQPATFQTRCPSATLVNPILSSPLGSQLISLAALQPPPTSMKGSFGSALGFFISLPRVFPAYFSAGLHPVTFSPRL